MWKGDVLDSSLKANVVMGTKPPSKPSVFFRTSVVFRCVQ